MSDETTMYLVVVNQLEQYSVWPADRADQLPEGWREAGFSGTRQECLEYIYALWTNWRSKGDIIDLKY